MTTCAIPKIDICVYKNARVNLLFRVRTKNKEEINFSEYVLIMQVRTSSDSPDIIQEFSSLGASPSLSVPLDENDEPILNTFILSISSLTTKDFLAGTFVHDVFMYKTGEESNKIPIMFGNFDIMNSVTRFE